MKIRSKVLTVEDPVQLAAGFFNPQEAEAILRYHHDSKHHYHRYARSPGYLDWENQPNPFRFYSGAAPVKLPFPQKDPAGAHPDLYRRRNNEPVGFRLENLAGFLELSLGLSAWKSVSGRKWSLRMNPSSGNLHPTEAYLILPQTDRLRCGLYHYNSFQHALEPRRFLPAGAWQKIERHFDTEVLLLGLSSIFWRESWKYGERAYRYCQLDIGHALACLSFSANLLGWKLTCLNRLSDRQVEAVLGADKTAYPELESEQMELLGVVYRKHTANVVRGLSDEVIATLAQPPCFGEPNRLSRAPVDWEAVYRTADRTRKPQTGRMPVDYSLRPELPQATSGLAAAEIIRRRRSAVAFDPEGSVSADEFIAMLDRTVPRRQQAPFDMEICEPCLNLLIFVHAVAGLNPGLYLFFRVENHIEPLKRRSKPAFAWQAVVKDFPLFLLEEKNCRREARMVSCDQEIAGSGVFSLGMIAPFRAVVAKNPYRYRHLFWEAGLIGQVLYLEAEAAGLRGTGIGCYFDDEVHEILGLKTDDYQSLYHFTVGKPIEDPRLQTLAPYHHLDSRRGIRAGAL